MKNFENVKVSELKNLENACMYTYIYINIYIYN